MDEKLPKIVTESLPGPKSRELLEKRKRYVARGVGSSTEVFIDEAKGALMKDIDGNIFLDFAGAIGVQNAGHCDDTVVEAIKSQAGRYIHPCFHIAMYEPYVALSEKLSQITPGSFPKKVMLANSGAEAVENAVKIARRYTKKTGIVSLETAFHGRTFMAMTLTSKVKPYKNGFGPFMGETCKIPSGYCYRCPLGCKYPQCGIACAEKFRTLLKGELSGDTIAALIAEPVQGEGGFIVPPKEYLQALQDICRENGILLIIDEVQSGFARTGSIFAAEHFELEPDIMTLSKSIAAGIPLSAVVGRAEIMDAANPGEIGGTYGGSPVACAAALKVIDKIILEGLDKKAGLLGGIIKERLYAIRDKYKVACDIRGLGAMIGTEFVKDEKTREPDPDIIKRITAYAFKKGVIFINAGIFGNVLRFLPPLVMSEEQANFGMDILDEAVKNALGLT
jgi:4-aminobutyrate aminotransferase/(S)-3-amino-2-methylpropionate transaminase